LKETFEDLGTRNATLPVVYQIFSEKEIERKSSFIIYFYALNSHSKNLINLNLQSKFLKYDWKG